MIKGLNLNAVPFLVLTIILFFMNSKMDLCYNNQDISLILSNDY